MVLSADVKIYYMINIKSERSLHSIRFEPYLAYKHLFGVVS